MRWDIIIALADNAILLLALLVIYEVTNLLPSKYRSMRSAINGVLIALICIGIMRRTFTLQTGIIFDTRSILISVTALMFGPIPTLMTVVAASIFRLIIGGVGVLAGLTAIFTSAIVGLAWGRWLYPKSTKWIWLNIYSMSIVVHVFFLISMLLVPYPENINVIREIIMPTMIIYPVSTVILSLLLKRQQNISNIDNQLKQSEERFRHLFDQAPLGYQSLDINGNFIDVNQTWLDMFGYSRDEVIGKWFGNFICPEYKDTFKKRFSIFKKQGHIYNEFEMLNDVGERVFIGFEDKIGYHSNDKFKQTDSILKDITQSKIAEKNLIESERSKSVLLSNLPGMAYRCNYDKHWTMQFVSEGCLNLTGYTPDSLLYNRDLSYNDLISPEYHNSIWNEWEKAIANKVPFKYEYEIITATGERKWVWEMGQGIYNEQGEVEALEGIVLDISDKKKVENHLVYITEHYESTGLYNRDYLEKVLEKDRKKRDGSKRALIGINLSTAQILDANYGFHYSQDLIRNAAEALSKYCTENRMLFQTYGKRFAFYLKNYKDKNELIDCSEVISEEMKSVFVTDRISGGIGILEIEEDEDIDADTLLRRLLIASESSINNSEKDFTACFYDKNLEAIVNREVEIRQELSRIAETENDDELFLHFQPIMDIRTNSICKFEALARLRTEKLGMVSPLEFIPIAEKTKLIIPLGEKIILSAFRFLNRLKDYGFERIGVSINISAIQLLRPDFNDRLFEMIKEMGVSPANISIEITESVFASNYKKTNNILAKLRDTGIQVDIDDFGTGYSSLSRVKELGVDCLKIDKSFVDAIIESEEDECIFSDIISIGHKLGHSTIAEGVEYESQLEYLRKHKCDKVQGYFISRPLDEDKALEFLKFNYVNGWNSNHNEY